MDINDYIPFGCNDMITYPHPKIDVCSFLRSPELDKCYCQIFNISRAFVGNKIVDQSDVIGASPIGAAPNASSFLT